MHKINYALIGTMPALNALATSLPKMIAEYKANRPKAMKERALLEETLRTGGVKAVEALMHERMKDPEVLNRTTIGVTIELCAQHFYGIDTDEAESLSEVIEAIEAADSELAQGA